MNKKLKHICLVNKHGIPKPAFCKDCHTCNSQNDVHLIHTREITFGLEKFQKEIKKWREYPKSYEQNFALFLR